MGLNEIGFGGSGTGLWVDRVGLRVVGWKWV